MQRKSLNYLVPFVIIFFVFIGTYFWFLDTKYFLELQVLAEENIYTFVLALFLIKIMSIVWPPLPGGLFTLGAIPFVGWETAYFIDLTGSTVGSMITYYLGKRYGLRLIKKLFDQATIDRIQKIKVKENKQTELVIVLRVFTGSVFMEAITYGAGLLKIRYSSFLVGSIISHAIVGVPVYYFAKEALVNPQSIILSLALLVGVVFILFKVKGRYLE